MSSVDWSTVQRFEAFDGISKTRSGTLEKIKKSLEGLGIAFIGDPINSPGAQLCRVADHEAQQGE